MRLVALLLEADACLLAVDLALRIDHLLVEPLLGVLVEILRVLLQFGIGWRLLGGTGHSGCLVGESVYARSRLTTRIASMALRCLRHALHQVLLRIILEGWSLRVLRSKS